MSDRRTVDQRPSTSLAETAYAEIRRRIISYELPPGSVVTEASLAQQLSIGRTPIREALSRLVKDGLIKSNPRHGYEISEITIRYVRELFALRVINEPVAMQWAAGHLDEPSLARMNELADLDFHRDDSRSIARFIELNHEFHTIGVNACDNQRLAALVVRLLEESQRIFYVASLHRDHSTRIREGHRALVDALATGDGQRASQITFDGIVAVQRTMLESMLLASTDLTIHTTTFSLDQTRAIQRA